MKLAVFILALSICFGCYSFFQKSCALQESIKFQIIDLNKRIIAHEQRIKHLEANIESQTKTIDIQSKIIQERGQTLSRFEQQIKNLQKQNKNIENFLLKFMTNQELEILKKESSGQSYQINLQNVASELNFQWEKSFKFQAEGQLLRITNVRKNIQDGDLSSLTKDIIPALEVNNLLNLSGLEIICQECTELTDKSFHELTNTISTLSHHLQSLHLDFGWCSQLTDESIKGLSNAISASSLKSFHLDLAGIHLTNTALADLTNIISAQSAHLQSLHLDFLGSRKFTDEAIKDLSNAISASHLQSLHLRFRACRKLTDESFKSLAPALSSQSLSLKSLYLNFEACTHLTDESLKHLATALSSQSFDLQYLYLYFDRMKGRGNTGSDNITSTGKRHGSEILKEVIEKYHSNIPQREVTIDMWN